MERVTGYSFTVVLAVEIWQKMGAESDAFMLTCTDAKAAIPLGINSSLRDMGRFGLLFTPSGRKVPYNIISGQHLQKIQEGGRPELFAASSIPNWFKDSTLVLRNTYQWDHVSDEGDFFKLGMGGQGLYISPSRDLVIAYFGTHDENGMNEMAKVSRLVAGSGLIE